MTQSANGSKRKRGHNATDANCEEEEAKRSGLNFAFKHPGCLALDEPYLGPMRKTCRELVGAPEGTSFPGQQPVSLTRKNLEVSEGTSEVSGGQMVTPSCPVPFFRPSCCCCADNYATYPFAAQRDQMLRNHEYLVSWKADGTRYLIMALGKRGVFAVGRDNSICKLLLRCAPQCSSTCIGVTVACVHVCTHVLWPTRWHESRLPQQSTSSRCSSPDGEIRQNCWTTL